MSKYKALKQERDEAVERAVEAERNSQLETLERERQMHADEVAALLRKHALEKTALLMQLNSLITHIELARSELDEALGDERKDESPEAVEAARS